VIWIDAHADANTPRTSPSGHYHGMPAAHLMGWFEKPGELGEDLAPGVALKGFDWFTSGCLPERRLAYIGLRDVDAVTERAIKAIDPEERCPIHLSLDIDGVDPFFAPGTGTCARGGLSYREVHYICEDLHRTDRMVSMDLVEVNPGIDLPVPTSGAMHGDDPSLKPASPTVRLAVELVLSALGKTILDPNRALEKE
jgi:arginase